MQEGEQVQIVFDEQGKGLVVIPTVIFRNRRNINWGEVEKYLRRYVGSVIRTIESNDIVYIGREFPDEYANSVYTRKLKGGAAKAKANLAQGILQVLKIADRKRWNKNYKTKHGRSAEKGWYRYNARFALPVQGEGEPPLYNVYQAVLVVRCEGDGKMYLYDVLDIKKETSNPF